ncbi:C-X-C chemokine receptor type 3.1 [Thalassophryne amazonica]|uniref:C-X-C chemokine receptor type 3.1 n=1 Tax=Thalassophryne amazonica TaxID=390379 RepID=UPI00147263C1|nr:C-X-C chemokine receptor type 3.1 [Thalassophryne amazonica]
MTNLGSSTEIVTWDDLGPYFLEDIFENATFPSEAECCDGGQGDVCNLTEGVNFEGVFIPVLYSVAFCVGFLGNGVLLVVLARSWRTWSVTDNFIVHLGVADTLLLLTLPLWAAQASQELGWTFGTPLCKMTGAVFTINFYCGIFLLACISLDRYLSIVHAAQMYSRHNSWVVQVSCLSVWIFSMLLSIPDWIFLEALNNTRRNKIECVPNYYRHGSQAVADWRKASRLLYHVVGFLLPSVIMSFCYFCILRQLRYGSQGFQKQKAFKVIMAVVVVFFVCWMPYNITLMVDTFRSRGNSETCGVKSSLEKAIIVTSTLGYLHCSLNPVLYAFVGVKFRRQLLDILRSLGCKLKSSVRHPSASSRRSSFWSESGDTSNSVAI